MTRTGVMFIAGVSTGLLLAWAIVLIEHAITG